MPRAARWPASDGSLSPVNTVLNTNLPLTSLQSRGEVTEGRGDVDWVYCWREIGDREEGGEMRVKPDEEARWAEEEEGGQISLTTDPPTWRNRDEGGSTESSSLWISVRTNEVCDTWNIHVFI